MAIPASAEPSPSPACEGADLLSSYLPEEQADAQESAKWVRDAGRQVITAPGDIQDQAHCKQLIERAVDFTKNLAQEVAERVIRGNTVEPGPIWTPSIPATLDADKVEGFGGDTPMGGARQLAEPAPAFVFFASPESSYVTGEVLGVTGRRPLLYGPGVRKSQDPLLAEPACRRWT